MPGRVVMCSVSASTVLAFIFSTFPTKCDARSDAVYWIWDLFVIIAVIQIIIPYAWKGSSCPDISVAFMAVITRSRSLGQGLAD